MSKMRALLVVLVAIFVLISSVNMVPARTFLEEIKQISKRQVGNRDYDFCMGLAVRCYNNNYKECAKIIDDPSQRCLYCLETTDWTDEQGNPVSMCLPAPTN